MWSDLCIFGGLSFIQAVSCRFGSCMCLLNEEHGETSLTHFCCTHKPSHFFHGYVWFVWCGVVWPQHQQFYTWRRCFSKHNEPENWTVGPREVNQISFISEEGIARGPPPHKSGDPASCEIASPQTWVCDLTICLFVVISWRESQTIQSLITQPVLVAQILALPT